MEIHAEATADHRQMVLIAEGADHHVAHAAKLIETLTPLFKASEPKGALVTDLTWPAVLQLAGAFEESWRPGPRLRQWITTEIAGRNAEGGGLNVELPAGCVPRAYQVEAAAMIRALGSALLLDEPGTGKTISAIIGLLERHQIAPIFPVLVVCPTSVVDPWVQAWRTWAPHLRTVAWRGSPKYRAELAGTADVYVVGYETARIDAQPSGSRANTRTLMKLGAATVVVDETHYLKNHQAKRSQAVRRLARPAVNVLALGGTPITHHPGDLWPTLEALSPAAWPSRERWVARYCLALPGDYDGEIIGLNPATETELRNALMGQYRRVAKADVLEQLPPKVYSLRSIAIPREYRRSYDEMEAQMIAELPNGEELSVMGVLAQLTRLSQLASAAADVHTTTEIDAATGQEREHVHVELKEPSWKVDALLEILAERPGQPVVAFAPSRQLMALAGAAADREGYAVGYVVGGQSQTERTQTIEHFQAGKLDLLCVTTSAGGVGLTLTAARTAVFLQRPWSYVEASQAEDRLHRIGAERHSSIEVIDVIATNTIDTRVRSVLREKAGQLADLVQDPRIVTELLGGSSK